MPRPKVNYDQVAATYNQRFHANPMPATLATLSQLVNQTRAQRVLEVGCGTGQWLSGLAQLGCQTAGLDFSRGMLTQAQARATRLELIQGQAEQLPFGCRCFDFLYCVNALHHFSEPLRFIQEARRVLCSGGRVAIIGMDPHGHFEDWYLYHYFPGTYETDLARFPTRDTVRAWLEKAGFHQFDQIQVEHIKDHKVGRAVLEDPFLQKDSTSQLILLSPGEYAEGIERIHQAIRTAEQEGCQVSFPVNLYLNMLTAVID